MPDGADAKAEFAETLMKFGVSLQQYISALGMEDINYHVRQVFNVTKLHVCSSKILQYNYPCHAYLNCVLTRIYGPNDVVNSL